MTQPVAISLVVPVFDEAGILPLLHERLTSAMQRVGLSYEIVLVDDGSRDESWAEMEKLAERDWHLVLIRLSRNFGHQIAITAGLDHSRGDAVVTMDADLQDPPEVVIEMIERWKQGNDVVYGRRQQRLGEGPLKRGTASLFYRLMRRLTSIDIPADTGDFRLMSRQAVEALTKLRERNRFVRGMVAWVGFRQTSVGYVREARHQGETKYPLRKMVRFAADAVFSFSFAPLRFATWLGLAASTAAFGYGIYAILARIFDWGTVAGWASLIVAIVFLGGVQLTCLGVIGEYIGRIYDEVKARPLYLTRAVVKGETRAPPA
jgi:glycosyltransferase involved in cell wall biosynthesis